METKKSIEILKAVRPELLRIGSYYKELEKRTYVKGNKKVFYRTDLNKDLNLMIIDKRKQRLCKLLGIPYTSNQKIVVDFKDNSFCFTNLDGEVVNVKDLEKFKVVLDSLVNDEFYKEASSASSMGVRVSTDGFAVSSNDLGAAILYDIRNDELKAFRTRKEDNLSKECISYLFRKEVPTIMLPVYYRNLLDKQSEEPIEVIHDYSIGKREHITTLGIEEENNKVILFKK